MLASPMWGMPFALEAEVRGGATRTRADRIEYDCILFDARRPQALNFAETARKLGARTRAMAGDIDDPCYDDLRRGWRNARTPVAGITDFRALLLLQVMASDAGMRPVLRIHHCGHGASMTHAAFGEEKYGAAAAAHLCRAGIHWSDAAARLVLSLAAGEARHSGIASDPGDSRYPSDPERRRAAVAGAAGQHALDSRMLVTWAIA